ncbi:MAG: hypothetical protein AB7F75_11690 [Planctomycetota bacterium]
MIRPKTSKKKPPKGSSPGCRLFAMLSLIVPLALGITAWVTSDEWMGKVLVNMDYVRKMRDTMVKAVKPADAERIKVAEEILSDRLVAGKMVPSELVPIRERYDAAMADGKMNEAEALDILTLAETFARKPVALPPVDAP